MHSKISTCIKVVGDNPECPSCNGCSIKYGYYSIKRRPVRHVVSPNKPFEEKLGGLVASEKNLFWDFPKSSGQAVEQRIYLGSYEIYRKFVSGSLTIERTTVHVSDDTGRIAMVEERTFGSDASAALLTRYVYSNHLQSAMLELDENAAIISYEEYHPFGTTAYQASNTAINAIAKRYRYTGKERDEESGLYYHGARYYIPWLARWSAVDALQSEMPTWSPYNYSFCNPIIFNDPSGNNPEGDRDIKGIWYTTGTVVSGAGDGAIPRWNANMSLNEFAEKNKDNPNAGAFREQTLDFREGTNAHERVEYTNEGKLIVTIFDDTKGGKVKSKSTKDFNPVKKAIEKKIEPKPVAKKEVTPIENDSNPLPTPIVIDTRPKPKAVAEKQYGSISVPASSVKPTPTIAPLQNLQKNESLLEKTADARAVATIVNTYVAGAADFVQDAHDDILDLKLTQKGVKNVSRLSNTLGIAGKFLGVTSMYEHFGKAEAAFKSGDRVNGWINVGKMALDGVFMFGKASNPFILFGGIGYTIWDMSGTMQW